MTTSRCAWCWWLWLLLALALGCGPHDTPVGTYVAPVVEPADAGEDAAASTDSGTDAGGPHCMPSYTESVPGGASRYKVVTARAQWVAAALDCESDGARLIVIDDQAENDWMASIAAQSLTDENSSHQLAWIGLGDSRVEGEFRSVTSALPAFAPWADGEPNSLYDDEDCVEIRASGQWNDDRCDAELVYVCECDGTAVPTGDWCDTSAAATCGDCDTPCATDQSCVNQSCE